jgi:hypothetical protein
VAARRWSSGSTRSGIFPLKAPVRAFAAFGAEGEVVLNAVAKRLLDIGVGLAFEGDHIAQADHAANEAAVFRFDVADVALVLKHRVLRLRLDPCGCQEIANSLGRHVAWFLAGGAVDGKRPARRAARFARDSLILR